MVYFKVLAAQTLYFRGELLHESKLDGGKAVKFNNCLTIMQIHFQSSLFAKPDAYVSDLHLLFLLESGFEGLPPKWVRLSEAGETSPSMINSSMIQTRRLPTQPHTLKNKDLYFNLTSLMSVTILREHSSCSVLRVAEPTSSLIL